jgi:hypothetical protein
MSTKTRYLEDEPATEAECQMLNILREWSGNDNNRLTIEYRDGAWEIAMSMTPHGKNQLSEVWGQHSIRLGTA